MTGNDWPSSFSTWDCKLWHLTNSWPTTFETQKHARAEVKTPLLNELQIYHLFSRFWMNLFRAYWSWSVFSHFWVELLNWNYDVVISDILIYLICFDIIIHFAIIFILLHQLKTETNQTNLATTRHQCPSIWIFIQLLLFLLQVG